MFELNLYANLTTLTENKYMNGRNMAPQKCIY